MTVFISSAHSTIASAEVFDAVLETILQARGGMSAAAHIFSALGAGLLLTVGMLITGMIFGRILALLIAKTRRDELIFDCSLYERDDVHVIDDRDLLEEFFVCTHMDAGMNVPEERQFVYFDGTSELEISEGLSG
jgi:hypothetical protein